MGDFSAEWLALREPADHRARSTDLPVRLARWQAVQGAPGPRMLLDLGAGTGSNLRFLAPLMGADQDWICVDQDPELLATLVVRTEDWARTAGLEATSEGGGLRIAGGGLHCRVATRRLDLAAGATALPLGPGTLVVASALMDLVSETWLADLLRACHRTRSPVLAALQAALSTVHTSA